MRLRTDDLIAVERETQLAGEASQPKPLLDYPMHHEMPHSACSLIPINRAELAITGREESSCKRAPVTGKRIPGMASPTAIASTESEKIRFCVMARIARRERESRWGSFARSSDKKESDKDCFCKKDVLSFR